MRHSRPPSSAPNTSVVAAAVAAAARLPRSAPRATPTLKNRRKSTSHVSRLPYGFRYRFHIERTRSFIHTSTTRRQMSVAPTAVALTASVHACCAQ